MIYNLSYPIEVNGEDTVCVSVRLYVHNIAPSVLAVRLSGSHV